MLFSAVVGPSHFPAASVNIGPAEPTIELPAVAPTRKKPFPKGKKARKTAKRMRQSFRAARAIVNPDSGETFQAKPGSRIARETEKFLRYVASRQDDARPG